MTMARNRAPLIARRVVLASAIVCADVFAQSGAAPPAAEQRPLPLDVAVSLNAHNTRSPIGISADGRWLAHTIATVDRIARDSVSGRYSARGVPFAEGDARMEVTVSSTTGTETIRVGDARSASWGAVWSPRGDQLAFYSDEGGGAGLWIWSLTTRERRRILSLSVRPFFGFETVEWTHDGTQIIVKVLSPGVTIAQANARDPRTLGPASPMNRFAAVSASEPSVIVRRAGGSPAATTPTVQAPAGTEGDARAAETDLVVVDVRSGAVHRLVERTAVRTHMLSPDGRSLAYTVAAGRVANAQQPLFDLEVVDVATTARRTLGRNLRMPYGIEWSWSPDSRRIATIASGQLARGEMSVIDVASATVKPLGGGATPSFDAGDGEHPPLWSRDGRFLYGIGDAVLWRIDATTGASAKVAQLDGWRFRTIVWPREERVLWTTHGGRHAYVIARAVGAANSAIISVDLTTGTSRAVIAEPKSYSGVFNITASDATQEILYVASGQRHLPELWSLNTKSGQSRQVSRINPSVDRYALGEARVIAWQTDDGQSLRGSLLLPPNYTQGRRLPLVVWVYGGSMGSGAVNQFGLVGMGALFNMQVLATRGYAVLFPDTPLRRGTPAADLLRTVMPGVDAAIEQGFVDASRLALMGQSYGSYNTLALITQTTRFKAAVITGNILHPDLSTDYLNNIGYYERGQGNMGGSLWEFPERYRVNSPLFTFDRIETALLMGQGERDGNLVPAEAIFTALQRLGKRVEYRLYEGEGHVISRAANVVDFWERRLAFLAEHLNLAVDAHGAVIPR